MVNTEVARLIEQLESERDALDQTIQYLKTKFSLAAGKAPSGISKRSSNRTGGIDEERRRKISEGMKKLHARRRTEKAAQEKQNKQTTKKATAKVKSHKGKASKAANGQHAKHTNR